MPDQHIVLKEHQIVSLLAAQIYVGKRAGNPSAQVSLDECVKEAVELMKKSEDVVYQGKKAF